MFAIKKGSLYVAVGGMQSSYTNNVEYAQKFHTREAAISSKCDNESVVDIGYNTTWNYGIMKH